MVDPGISRNVSWVDQQRDGRVPRQRAARHADQGPKTPQPLGGRRLAATVAVLTGLAIGLLAYGLFFWPDGGAAKTTVSATASGPASASASPTARVPASIVSVAELKAAPGRIGHPLFWAGQRPGTQLELSLGSDGASYVRYLPLDTPAGSPKSDFTLVATYQDQEAYSRLQSGAERAGAVSVKGANGALMMTASSTATNAYFSFPDVPLLVEVYDPAPGEAYRLIQSGLVQLVR